MTLPSSSPLEIPKAAEAVKPDTRASLEALRVDVEKNRKENQEIYTRVESWILGEGSKPGENKIDFGLWNNAATAEKDLQTIFRQFPEFEKLCNDQIIKGDPGRKENFIKLFGEKLSGKIIMRQEKTRELALLGEKNGSEPVGDLFRNGWKDVKKWAARGEPMDYVKIGGVIAGSVALYYALKFGVKTTVDQLDENPSWIVKGAVLAGIGTGLYFGAKALEPKSAYGAEIPHEGSSVSPEIAAQQKIIEKTIETESGARAILGLTGAPMEEVLDQYRRSENQNMSTEFLANHIGKFRDFDALWVKRMLAKIRPKDLYLATRDTLKAVEYSYGYKKASGEDKNLTVLDYVEREYVTKAKERNTTIIFSEFVEDTLGAGNQKTALA